MHERLVLYGRIILRDQAKRAAPDPDADRDVSERFTGQQAEEAYLLHLRVVKLPEVRQRFVLQTFYRDGAAARWEHLSPTYCVARLVDLTAEVNDGLREYNRTGEGRVAIIRATDFEGIRMRSIRILVNSEALLNSV